MATIENFPTNSQQSPPRKDAQPKEPEKDIQPIVEGEIVRRKQGLGKKFAQTFMGGDAKSTWQYVVWDVLMPAAKDMVADAASQGVERMIFGEARSSSRRTGFRPGATSNNNVNNYTRFSQSTQRADPRPSMSRQARASHNFDEIVVPTRLVAEEVIDKLEELLERYKSVSVGDLYNLVGVTPSFVDEKWGWMDLTGAGVQRVRDGYLLNLPRTEQLD